MVITQVRSGEVERLPPELQTVLNTEGYSILLYGDVGLGKTSLGLEMLARSKNPFYLSLVSPAEYVHSRYPWIMDHLPPNRILDLRKFIDPTGRKPRIKTFKTRILRHFQPEAGEAPTIFFNNWTTFLQSSELQESEWPKWHNALLEAARQNSWRLIIATPLKDRTLEAVVDGVVHLIRRPMTSLILTPFMSSPPANVNKVRLLSFEKLTSIQSTQRNYLFSIARTRFRFIPTNQFAKSIPPPKPIRSTGNHISSGIRELDELLGGGYPRAATTLLEVTASVARRRHPLIKATVVNALRTGLGLLYLIEEDIPLNALISQHLLPFVGKPKLKHLHLGCLKREGIPECKDRKSEEYEIEPPGYCQTPLHPNDLEKTLEQLEETREIIHQRYESFIEIIESHSLERLYQIQSLPILLNAAKEAVWLHNSALIFVVDHITAYHQRLRRLTDYHLLLDVIEGVPILQGLNPHFDPHAFEIRSNRGLTLTPVS
jgi:hypothetical protein